MGKVPSRVKFDEDGFPIPQTMQTDTVQFDEDGLPIPVKKKAVGTDLSMVGGKAVPNGGQVGSSNPQLEKDKVLEYLKIGKPAITVTAPSVKEAESVSTLLKNKGIPESNGAVVETKIKKNESPFDQTKDEAFLAANEKLNEVMYGEGDEWLDPIKANIIKAQNSSNVKDAMANIGANNIVEMSLAPSGYYADKILKNSIWSQATEGNLTANMLRQKAEDYKKRTSSFQEIQKSPNDTGNGSGNPEFYKYVYGQQIDNAAIKSYAEKNPNFKEQLQASGIDLNDPYLADRIGSAKAGQIISESIFDPEVIEYAKHEAPWLLPALKVKANTLINDYKDFGINHVANKVSRAIQESGYNNIDPIFNFANDNMKEFARSTAKLELTPEEYDIYEKNILGNEEKYLDTPSFFEGFAGAGKSMLSGIKNTLTTPFKSIPEKIREGWEKEATNVSADPKGLMKVIRDSGHAVGIVSSLAAMGNVLGGGGTGFYSTKVVPALSGAIPFMGDFIEEGTMKYPNNPVKAWTSALFNTAMYSALSYKIFPVKDVQNAFKNIKPEVAEIVENLASGKITREVARREMSTLAKKGFDLLTGSVAKSAKISAELTGITALNSMLDKVMGMDGQTFEKYHPEGEEADAFTSLFLSNLVVGGMAKFGEMKRGNRIVEQSLYSAASNPKRFQDIIDKLEVKDPTINKQEMLDNLTYLTQVKDGLDKAGVDTKNQARYLFEAMKEKVQSDAIKSTPDANITRMGEAKISESRKIKDRILQGEDVVAKEQSELAKEISKDAETTEQILNKAVEDGYIEGTYADMVMQGKGEEMLKEISQQAQNITSDGQPHNPELADIARKSAEQQVGKKIVALAIEKYPLESFKKGEPEEISKPIELDPNLPEGYQLPEQQQQINDIEARKADIEKRRQEEFRSAGEQSKIESNSNAIANDLLQNAKVGDTITDKNGEGYEITDVKTRKDGTKEVVLVPFELVDGKKDYNYSGTKLISETNKKAASNLYEFSYTNSNGERVTETYTYNAKDDGSIPGDVSKDEMPVKEEQVSDIETKKADIEKRRQEELSSVKPNSDGWVEVKPGEYRHKKHIIKEINDKYDKEIFELRIPEVNTENKIKQEQVIENNDKTGLVLYHGSPHSFENFDISKLGTGEGRQAFGHGLYFTNEPEIAKTYANVLGSKKNFWEALQNGYELSLSKEDYDFIKKELDSLGFDGETAENADLGSILINGEREYAPDVLDAMSVLFGKNAKENLKSYDLSESEINRLLEIKKKISDPQFYKVLLHEGKKPSEYEYIDWREKLTDSQKKKLGEDALEDATGEEVYKTLSKKLGSDKKASEYLLSKGIDGITYKSEKGTGGKTGEGRNYVVFDVKSIRVDEINNKKQQQQETDVNIIEPKTQENAIQIGSTEKTNVGETPGDSGTMGEGVPQPKEPAGTRTKEEGKIESKEGVAEPPNTPPPIEPISETEKENSGWKKKALLNKLYNSKNIPESAKEAFEKEGLYYKPKSREEASKVAKGVIDELGIDDAITMAKSMEFDGDVNSLIYGESLNRLADQESNAKTEKERIEAAKRFAEIGIEYQMMGQYGGRFNSAINYFYKKSPLGIVLMENAKRQDDFKNWSKPKEKSWKEGFDELMKDPEFKKVFEEQVGEKVKEERKETRKAKREKVHKAIDETMAKWAKKFSANLPEGTKKAGASIDVFKAAATAMKKAYDAGESVGKVIQDAIDYITKETGVTDWDKDGFAKEWAERLTEKGGKVITDEELKSKVLDRFRKKLNGLTDKQKEEVVRKSFKKLIDNGALEYDEFKKIIQDVVGRGELTADEQAKLKELVGKTNAVEEAAKKWREEKTEEAEKEFRKAEIEAGKATRELNEMLWNRPDVIKRITSIMQLNTLGIPALINNPIYNIWNQATLRFPIGVVNDLIDRSISGIAKLLGKNYERDYNVWGTQLEFFKKLGFGSKESLDQLRTGLNRMDYIQKEVYGQQIRPGRAIRDLYAFATGKKNLTKSQIIDKALQSTVGVPAEAVARMLNIGDKPQRFAAEGSQAATFAKNLGLKDMDYKLFIEFPREEAYRIYKEQGLSDAEAGKKADYIKDVILKEGQRSTFQQDNLLNSVINAAFGVLGGKDSGYAALAKTLTVSPFIKIPSNAFWSYYNLVNPEVAILQSMIHAGRAKSLIGKGDNSSKLAMREARYWFAHAIVGMAMRAVVIGMVQAGVFRPANDEDDTKKEREGEAYYEPQGTVNLNKLSAWLRGEDPTKVKGGVLVQNRWFGQWGTVGNSIAKKWQDAKPEQREKQDEFWNIVLGGMEVDALKEMGNGVFANTSSLLSAIDTNGSFGWNQYGLNTLGLFTNILHPATFAQISRAELNEATTNRADTFLGQLKNAMLTRSSVLRKLTGQYPETKVGIWGDKIQKQGGVIERLFGVTPSNKDAFARPIYDDAVRTNDIGFFPPAVQPKIGDTKLNQEQYNKFQEYVGKARRSYVAPFINDQANIIGFNVLYSQLNDDDKKYVLQYLYGLGSDEAKEKFFQDYPELKPKEEEVDYKKEIERELFKTLQKYQ